MDVTFLFEDVCMHVGRFVLVVRVFISVLFYGCLDLATVQNKHVNI